MKRTALLTVAVLAGLALPALGAFCAPAEAAVSVVVPRPTVVINVGGQPAPEAQPAPVVVREVERVRYVEVPRRPTVRYVPVTRVQYVEVPARPYEDGPGRHGREHGHGHGHGRGRH